MNTLPYEYKHRYISSTFNPFLIQVHHVKFKNKSTFLTK